MINEEKVGMMTKLQAYEDGPGKRDVAIANFFRGDYLGSQVLRGVICVTIAMIILYAGSILYDVEAFMKSLYQIDLLEYAKTLTTKYLMVVIAYAILTYLVYAIRYAKAKKNLRHYYGELKRLNATYNSDEA